MSDDYGVHHPVAAEMREARELRDQLAHQNARGPRSAFFGEGIGAASGWAFFFGLLGFAVGIFMGGVVGAIVTAVVFAGVFLVIAFVARRTMSIWNRGPVFVWFILGGVVFFLIGGVLQGEGINWAFVGAPVAAAFRYLMKDVK